MSDTNPEYNDTPLTVEEKHTALFAQMVMQSASMAMMFMGRTPNPVSGKTETDLDAARMFIEQLEMVEAKTRGNLTREEEHLLRQNLMTVRLAFVESVGDAGRQAQVGEAPPKPAEADVAHPPEAPEDGSKRKFSKSYGAG